jgi:MFS transporter, PPP family, 3-phenylpropionic acid transporter
MLVRLAAGALVGLLADLLGSLHLVLATCAALATGTAAALLLANTFWLLFFIALARRVD